MFLFTNYFLTFLNFECFFIIFHSHFFALILYTERVSANQEVIAI